MRAAAAQWPAGVARTGAKHDGQRPRRQELVNVGDNQITCTPIATRWNRYAGQAFPWNTQPSDLCLPHGIVKKMPPVRGAASFAHAHRRSARSGATAIDHHMSARYVS
jgi:hypothetical protein